MLVNADFHIHSLFSMATSPAMKPPAILEGCLQKGIDVLGCGDALQPEWRHMWEPCLENDAGILVLPTAEVEGMKRVHHLIFMKDFAGFEELTEIFRPFSRDILKGGRPHVRLSGKEIALAVHELGGLVGPAHAFTPWTGLYGHFDSLQECYGEENIDFLELGLSADSSYGDAISELYDVPFLSNSDAHSASPLKLGREFNRMKIQHSTPEGVFEALKSGSVLMNAGFFPEEGKYNRTACTRCFEQYSLKESASFGWKCPKDGGRIKAGVYDRAMSLCDGEKRARPPYYHIIPLGEIIMTVLGTSSPVTKKCQSLHQSLISSLGNETGILTDVPVDEIREVNRGVGDAIGAFRRGEFVLYPGGGGKYGSFSLSV